MTAASIPEYMFITVTCCKEIAKKLFKHFLQLFTCIFWLLHLHQCIRHHHHCLGSSRTLHFLNFQDQTHFPGPGNFTHKIPGLSRRRGNPVQQSVISSISAFVWSDAHTVTHAAKNTCKNTQVTEKTYQRYAAIDNMLVTMLRHISLEFTRYNITQKVSFRWTTVAHNLITQMC